MRSRPWPVSEASLVRILTQVCLAASLAVGFSVALAVEPAMSSDGRVGERSVLLVLVASVLLFGLLHSWSADVAHRLVVGRRASAYDVLAGLAARLDAAHDAPAQIAVAAEAVATALGVSYVTIEITHTDGQRLSATVGREPSAIETLTIRYGSSAVGQVRLPARRRRGLVSARDEALLGDLVRQTILAARARQLVEDLQKNRERLVVAREDERRRLRRDLHDELGPALSGDVFQLETARLVAGRDPAAARRILRDVGRHLDTVSTEVLKLVNDLRPAALDDLGLVGAVEQQARALAAPGLRITVSADPAVSAVTPAAPLPAALEVAAYRIIGEGLTNVVRHSDATSATVGLRLESGFLVVEVTDDGVGMPADVRAGVGLVSMRERAAELGGRSEVACTADGGTRLRAWLPADASPTP